MKNDKNPYPGNICPGTNVYTYDRHFFGPVPMISTRRKKKMKKWFAYPLALAVACAGIAAAEAPAGEKAAEENVLAQLEGQTLYFSSGVGGWYTSLNFGEEGAFTGEFHDSEMGETGEDYPDGTVYGCLFHGKLSAADKIADTAWRLKVDEVLADEGQVPESIEDGIRYVTSDPYGLYKAREVVLYLPGTPVSSLPEGFLFWSQLEWIAPDAGVLPYYAIWNEAEEAGFIGDVMEAQAETGLSSGHVVTALATYIDPNHLSGVCANARITGYSKTANVLTVEIIIPEEFAEADIESLSVGDAIYTGGREVAVRTLEEDDWGYIVINKGEEDEVQLYELSGGIYRVADANDCVWNVLTQLQAPFTESLLFLDGIDPSDGTMLSLPTVHTGAEFLEMLDKENGVPGFAANNVTVVFDPSGDLAIIQRTYVPWQ